jgi:predicted transcriptional regulator
MSTLDEIRTAITHLNPREQALLTAELFAIRAEPDGAELELPLQRGLDDVAAGRVHEIEHVKKMIPEWILKSPTP